MNSSKLYSNFHWRKLYSSGAVKQKVFPEGVLVIDAIGTFGFDTNELFQTITLGRIIHWHGWKPICAIVVPENKKNQLGVILDRMPNNAVPVEIFFGK